MKEETTMMDNAYNNAKIAKILNQKLKNIEYLNKNMILKEFGHI